MTTDLLNVLKTIGGFGQNQNKPSGAITDLNSDQTKPGTGYANNDHTAKTTLKDLLKPHE
ncbi:hypothetical protein [Mesorhizobium sp. SARCC-RB16n]|uniref:hypothetical protein n=1 Tax=Mesorhizobium sp. SARCC-RB16n TaxID=2116687 RepID=UPI0035900F21